MWPVAPLPCPDNEHDTLFPSYIHSRTSGLDERPRVVCHRPLCAVVRRDSTGVTSERIRTIDRVARGRSRPRWSPTGSNGRDGDDTTLKYD